MNRSPCKAGNSGARVNQGGHTRIQDLLVLVCNGQRDKLSARHYRAQTLDCPVPGKAVQGGEWHVIQVRHEARGPHDRRLICASRFCTTGLGIASTKGRGSKRKKGRGAADSAVISYTASGTTASAREEY